MVLFKSRIAELPLNISYSSSEFDAGCLNYFLLFSLPAASTNSGCQTNSSGEMLIYRTDTVKKAVAPRFSRPAAAEPR